MATSARLDELKKKFDESPRRYFAPLANEFRKLGDLTQAIAICRAHLPNQPGHVSGHIVLAQALYESRELGESRVAFEQALDLDPENLIALRYLGDIAREQDAPDVARAWYERVLDADPRNEEIAALLTSLPAEQAVASDADYPDASEHEATSTIADAHDAGAAPPLDERWGAPAPETVDTETFSFASPTHEVTPPPPALVLDETTTFATEETVEFTPAPTGAVFEEFAVELPSHDVEPTTSASATMPNDVAAADDDPFAAAFAEADAHAQREEVISLSDLEAIAEPQESAWFQEAAPQAEASEVSFSETLFADISNVTPASTSALSSNDINAFSLSLSATPPMGVDSTPAPEAIESAHQPAHQEHEDDPFDFGQPLTVAAADTESATPAADDSSETAAVESDDLDFSTRPTPQLPMATISPWAETPATNAFAAIEGDDHAEASTPSLTWGTESSAATEQTSSDEAAHAADVTAMDAAAPEAVDVTAIDAAAPEAPEVQEHVVEALSTSDSYFADVVDEHLAPAETEAEAEAPTIEASHDEQFENDPVYGRTPAFGNEAVEETPDAFVTETMAELYVQQGFTDDALAIYQQLLSRNPNDQTLKSRIEALTLKREEPAPAPQVERAGQSARSFFAQFARRAPRRALPGESSLPLADAGAQQSDAPVMDTAPATFRGVATRDEAMTVPDDDRGNTASSLESLFGTATQSHADESAAGTLASAFSAESATTQSTDAGAQELSLQHLFGDVPSKSASTVSLDEFFATSRDASASPNELTPNGGERADIEQFTAWLEGLKKK